MIQPDRNSLSSFSLVLSYKTAEGSGKDLLKAAGVRLPSLELTTRACNVEERANLVRQYYDNHKHVSVVRLGDPLALLAKTRLFTIHDK